jgi:hypothetical protein
MTEDYSVNKTGNSGINPSFSGWSRGGFGVYGVTKYLPKKMKSLASDDVRVNDFENILEKKDFTKR